MTGRKGISKAKRDALVLQMFHGDTQEMQREADSLLAVTPEQYHALLRDEVIQLYLNERAYEDLKQSAIRKALEEKNGEALAAALDMAGGDKRLMLQQLLTAGRFNSQLLLAESASDRLAARANRDKDPDPLGMLAKSALDSDWRPPTTASKRLEPRPDIAEG